jgi:hypothetical protein
VRDIFCFFCGGEETKWERVVSAVKGSKEVCMRRCDEEGMMFVMYKAVVCGERLKAAANRGKVIRAWVEAGKV